MWTGVCAFARLAHRLVVGTALCCCTLQLVLLLVIATAWMILTPCRLVGDPAIMAQQLGGQHALCPDCDRGMVFYLAGRVNAERVPAVDDEGRLGAV